MDEIVKQLMKENKWPFRQHITEDGEMLTAPPIEEPPLEEALF